MVVRMSALDYEVEPSVDCPDTDFNDVAFIRATTMIGGHDVVKEFLAGRMYPLSVGFDFKNLSNGTTAMSKVVVPLPIFSHGASFDEDCRMLFGEGGQRHIFIDLKNFSF
jgi:hypothetical protein